eukprot:scaffold7692_cov163-Amphora_coffeaeformis.AAC.8
MPTRQHQCSQAQQPSSRKLAGQKLEQAWTQPRFLRMEGVNDQILNYPRDSPCLQPNSSSLTIINTFIYNQPELTALSGLQFCFLL